MSHPDVEDRPRTLNLAHDPLIVGEVALDLILLAPVLALLQQAPGIASEDEAPAPVEVAQDLAPVAVDLLDPLNHPPLDRLLPTVPATGEASRAKDPINLPLNRNLPVIQMTNQKIDGKAKIS